MSNANTSNNNAVVNNNVKGESTMSKIFNVNNAKVAAATPFTLAGAGAAFVAEVCRASAEKIAGDQVSRAPGYGYLAAHTTGKLSSKRMAAMAEALKAQAAMKEEKAAPTPQKASRRESHSPNVVLNKDGFWEPKEAGKGVASLYKAANKARMVLVAGKKWEDVPSYPDKEGNFLNLAGWTLHGIRQHAEWREKEGDEGVWTPKVLKGYLSQAFRLCADPEEIKGKKLPSFEELVKLSGEEWVTPKTAPTAKTAPKVAVSGLDKIGSKDARDLINEIAQCYDHCNGLEVYLVENGYAFASTTLFGEPVEIKVRLSDLKWASAAFEAEEVFKEKYSLEVVDAHEVPAQEQEEIVSDDGLPRDGGAPGQAAPAPASGEAARTFTALVKALHLGRITEGNALGKAKAVAAAYEAGTINAAELDSLRKAIEKKFKGDQEQLEAAFAA